MDAHFPPTREDVYHLQMDIRQLQAVQNNHAERLLRLEKRQADDAVLKSVWNSPFPSVLGGTPQQGPLHTPSGDVFDDFDDQEQNLLGSLQLEADDEPVRRGASRANSVRFDVSTLPGGSWAQTSRSSGEFAPTRPSSGFGGHTIERTLSHKSDGRQSSAGHSIHSVHSAHSAPSGRTSSLGLEAQYLLPQDDEPGTSAPDPAPGLLLLGPVPCIIRCWLDTNFSHNALLYAAICTGSHRSLVDFHLVEALHLVDQIQRHPNGYHIRLPVYLPEAVVKATSNSSAPQLPFITVTFDVVDMPTTSSDRSKAIQVFVGSDTLRMHHADILLSQNAMMLYGDDRNKLTVPFVRPEDDAVFKHLRTGYYLPEMMNCNPAAPREKATHDDPPSQAYDADQSPERQGFGPDVPVNGQDDHETTQRNPSPAHRRSSSPREPASSRWGAWKQHHPINGGDGGQSVDQRKSGRSRGMKVLKPSKSLHLETTSSEAPSSARPSSDGHRKGQAGTPDGPSRWDTTRAETSRLHRSISSSSRTSNPVGSASAFAWMNPGKARVPTTE